MGTPTDCAVEIIREARAMERRPSGPRHLSRGDYLRGDLVKTYGYETVVAVLDELVRHSILLPGPAVRLAR